MSTRLVIHLGNAGKGAIECGAREQKEYHGRSNNWAWTITDVTCKRCIKAYKRAVQGAIVAVMTRRLGGRT